MNELVFKSSNENDGFAVFSEVYYPYGWQAFIDQKPVPHYQVDYTLRGLMVPSGEHEIRFKFEPKVIQTGSYVSLAGHFILAVFIVIGGWKFYNERKTGHPNS